MTLLLDLVNLTLAADVPKPSAAEVTRAHDVARVYDLEYSQRPVSAATAAVALITADPEDLSAQTAYLYQHINDGPGPTAVLLRDYTAWAAQAPADPVRRITLGVATAIAADPGGHREEFLPARAGPWCEPVLGAFEALPAETNERVRALWLEHLALNACARDDTAVLAEIAALEPSTSLALGPAVWVRLDDQDVSVEDAQVISRMLAVVPWRMTQLPLWAPKVHGDGLAAARDAAVLAARAAAAGDDPMLVAAAGIVLWRSGAFDDAAAANARLQKLEPVRNVPTLTAPSPGTPTPGDPAPAAIGDPAVALAALDAGRAQTHGVWSRTEWFRRRAELLTALGRDEEALGALRHAYWLDPSDESNIAFAKEALRQHRRLAAAFHAADVALEAFGWPLQDGRSWGSGEAGQRTRLAEAYGLRAAISLARGDTGRCERDANESLLLHDDPAVRELLGLAMVTHAPDAAFIQLTRALAAGGSGDAAQDAKARAALDALWPERGWWSPTGVDGWLASWKATATAEPAAPPTDRVGEPFPNLTLTLGGAETTVAALSGPLVIDVWATWCGPCREALPRFDAAARRHPGVTFLAISVDEDAAAPARYLANSKVEFQSGWAGPDAVKALGVSGVPDEFVLDADHHIVTALQGYDPLNDPLEAALTALIRN